MKNKPFKAIYELFLAIKITFSEVVAHLFKKPPRKRFPVSYENFTLFFDDHIHQPIGYIKDTKSNERFKFTHKINIGEKPPEGAQPVFTAFPRQMYVLETSNGEWIIYGVDPNGKPRTVLIEDQAREPANRGSNYHDGPTQPFGKNQL